MSNQTQDPLLICRIEGGIYYLNPEVVQHYDQYAILQFPHNVRFYVFPDAETAGELAKEYWEDLAITDPQEFECLVGAPNLIAWAKNEFAGPGSTQTQSLEEWFDLWLDTPAEYWGSYDGVEYGIYFDVDTRSQPINSDGSVYSYEKSYVEDLVVQLLGFLPTVAYRS